MPDILDRWTIALLKKHLGGLDMDAEIAEYVDATAELRTGQESDFRDWFARLLIHNSRVWVFESEIRKLNPGEADAVAVSKLAFGTRESNAARCAVKQQIAEKIGERKELKTDCLANPSQLPR